MTQPEAIAPSFGELERGLLDRNANNASTLMRAPLFGTRSYFRSKTLLPHIGINPLVAAATPLLTVSTKLKETLFCEDLAQLHDQLVHEVKAFETAASSRDYRAETILIARYMLCTTLDELIEQTNFAKAGQWNSYKLLMEFQKNPLAMNDFFLILQRLVEDPRAHIDLLELIYLCLSLGFEGKYREHPQGRVALDEVTEELYQSIRWQRGDTKSELNQANQTKVVIIKQPPQTLSMSWIAALTIGIIITLFAGYNYLLSVDTVPIIQRLHGMQ